MKKVNLFFLILLSIFLFNCETTEIQEDTKPLDPRGCTFDGDDCDDGPGGGSGGPGGGGGPSTIYKIYMKGKNTTTVNQGSSYNGTSWYSQGQVTSAVTNVSPAAAYFDNKIFTFHHGNLVNNPIKYSYSTNDGTTWTSGTVVSYNEFFTNTGMSAVAYNNRIYLAVTDGLGLFEHEVRVYSSPTGTSNWTHHSTPIAGVDNPNEGRGYLAVHNNELYIFYVAKHSLGQIFYKKFNGVSWNAPVEVTGIINGVSAYGTDEVAAYSHNGNLYAVYNTSSNRMVSVNALSSNNTGYYVGTAQTSTFPSLTSDGTNLVLVYKGNSDSHVFYSRSTNGQSWTGNLWAVGETELSPYIISY